MISPGMGRSPFGRAKYKPFTFLMVLKIHSPASVLHRWLKYCTDCLGVPGSHDFRYALEKSKGTGLGTLSGSFRLWAIFASGSCSHCCGTGKGWPATGTKCSQCTWGSLLRWPTPYFWARAASANAARATMTSISTMPRRLPLWSDFMGVFMV